MAHRLRRLLKRSETPGHPLQVQMTGYQGPKDEAYHVGATKTGRRPTTLTERWLVSLIVPAGGGESPAGWCPNGGEHPSRRADARTGADRHLRKQSSTRPGDDVRKDDRSPTAAECHSWLELQSHKLH